MDAPYLLNRDMKDYKRETNPALLRNEFEDNPVEKLTDKDDCARLFEFDNDAPLVMENKDYREIIGLNRGTDDSRRTFAKPESPDYMHDSGIGKWLFTIFQIWLAFQWHQSEGLIILHLVIIRCILLCFMMTVMFISLTRKRWHDLKETSNPKKINP